MAFAATTRIIENGSRDLIMEFVGIDTAPTAGLAEEAAVVKVNAGTLGLSTNPSHTKIRRILYNVSNANVYIRWDGATPTDIALLSGWGDYNLDNLRSGSQGIFDDALTPTGNITFTTTAIQAVATGGYAGYTITLFMIKGLGF